VTTLATVLAAVARDLRDELAEARVIVAYFSQQRFDARAHFLAVRVAIAV
jgi:hypothetical protein